MVDSLDAGFNPQIEYRPVDHGIKYVIQRSDGSGIMGWAATRDRAEKKVERIITRDGGDGS